MSLGRNTDRSVKDGRHPTGITILDEEVIRGIPKGYTIAIVSSPDSESELILHSLASTTKNTKYVTTSRPRNCLMDDILRSKKEGVDENKIKENIDIIDLSDEKSSLNNSKESLTDINEEGHLIIDSFSSLYLNHRDELLELAKNIYKETRLSQGLTYLYFVAEDTDKLSRTEKEILHMVDGVFKIETTNKSGKVNNDMYINKLRGIDVPDSSQSLVFGKKLSIESTDDIG